MLYLLCLQRQYCIFQYLPFRSTVALVHAVNVYSPLQFPRVAPVAAKELRSCGSALLAQMMNVELRFSSVCPSSCASVPCWAQRAAAAFRAGVQGWAQASGLNVLSPVPSLTISSTLAGQKRGSQTGGWFAILISLTSPPNWKRTTGDKELIHMFL